MPRNCYTQSKEQKATSVIKTDDNSAFLWCEKCKDYKLHYEIKRTWEYICECGNRKKAKYTNYGEGENKPIPAYEDNLI